MSFNQFITALNNEEAEGELVKTIFVSLIASLILFGIVYFLKLKTIENFIPKYGFFLFFAILSYSLILPSIRYVRAYKEFSCMSGMMIGMTTGMISGFLLGFFIASTNGMFVGSVFGMSIGIISGVYNGKCCGVMGIMEGVMAGFMGGLMGAMTAFMLINDHLKTAAVIIFFISSFILFGLNFIIYKETREMERKHKDHELFIILLSLVLTTITIWLSVFGPRSLLFQ